MNINSINPFQGLQNALIPDGRDDAAADNRRVSSVNQGQSNMAVVYDPPFFPIATYQRQDIIKKVKSIEGEVPRPVRDQGLQNTLLDNKLKNDATDAVRAATAENIKPGTILTIKA